MVLRDLPVLRTPFLFFCQVSGYGELHSVRVRACDKRMKGGCSRGRLPWSPAPGAPQRLLLAVTVRLVRGRALQAAVMSVAACNAHHT